MDFDHGNRLITALDVPDRGAALTLASQVRDPANMRREWVKVGLELFSAEGPELVRELRGKEFRIMLDLKLHDIPATVGRAAARISTLGAELMTIHASGGEAMMRAAVEGAGASKVLAITVLTSLDQKDLELAIGSSGPVGSLVCLRAELAIRSGCFGVVCSPQEAGIIRQNVTGDYLIITPGVRPAGAEKADQKRVTTPHEARTFGADMVVVGRPIRDAEDPRAAASAIAAELARPI